MKKILALVLVIALVLTLFAACGGAKEEENAQPASDKKVIGIILIDLTNQFFIDMVEGGDQAAKDYGVDVIWKSSDGSIDKQISLMENFIEQKVDCILVNPIDSAALKDVIQKASDAGIPTVAMAGQVDVPNSYTTVYNDFENTEIIGHILANLVGKEGKVALLYGNTGNLVSDMRQGGFEKAMKEYPNIQLIEQPMNWDPATGLKAAQDIIAANPDLKGIHCVSDAVTLAAYQAVKDAGLEKQITVTSYDGNPDSCLAVEKGEFALTLLTGSKRAGYWNVQVGAMLANGEKPAEQVINMATHFVMTPEMKAKVEAMNLAYTFDIIGPQDAIDMANLYTDFEPKDKQ
jgi:ribose transport system substrate-binding protein